MSQYLCTKCGYVYDEEFSCKGVFFEEVNGEIVEGVIDSTNSEEPFTAEINGIEATGVIEHDELCADLGLFPGTRWEDLPGSFRCPRCKAEKNEFRKVSR